METGAAEVLETFNVTRDAERKYQWWCNNPTKIERGVVDTVLGHTSRVIYRITTQDIEAVCDKTEHALGNIDKATIVEIVAARDWESDFAFVHLFHFLMEHLGRPPLWQEFTDFFYETEVGLDMFGHEKATVEASIEQDWLPVVRKKYANVRISDDQIERKAHIDAANSLQWRIGNAYYGFLRDIYTVVELRSRGLNVKSHPLADALFRTDCWADRNLVSLYVGNVNFRAEIEDKHAGRKLRAEQLLGDAAVPFTFVPITLPAAEKFGDVLLPSKQDLGKAEQMIRGQRSALP